MSTKQAIIFTIGYPYGDREVTFLHEEVRVLANYYNEIILIPYFADTTLPVSILPLNVRVINIPRQNSFKRNLTNYSFVLKLFLREVTLSKNIKLFKNIRYHLSELVNYFVLAKSIDDLLRTEKISENSLYYTYWFDQWSSALLILKLHFHRKISFVTRAHGFDLYDERRKRGYIFPRSLQMENVKTVYAISKNGKEYLASKFPKYYDKCKFARLGISKLSEIPQINYRSNKLVIVSCSLLIPLKRVHKIIEILSYSKENITWVHFGSGVLKDKILSLAMQLPPNVTLDFRGNIENGLIKKFYNSNYVDWFINVSEFEGIPVSIMEAISYGIPVLATKVGGVSEIVNETTGILIDKNFESQEVISILETVKFSESQRADIIEFWQLNYSASYNYESFAEELLSNELRNA